MLDLNALDVLNSRRIHTNAPHFSKIMVQQTDWDLDQNLENWITANLKGRYYIISQPYVSDDGKLKNAKFAGFEDHKEITYFILACPHLRRN